MELISDVIYYLNKVDFTDKINDTVFENLKCGKRVLVN